MSDIIITLDEVKSILQISNTNYDDLIEETLIPSVQDYVQNYCNDDFLDGFPSGLKLAVAKLIQYQLSNVSPNISSETIGKYSVSYVVGYPKEITDMLNNYRKVFFV